VKDVTIKRLEDLDGFQGKPGAPKHFLYAGRGLGVSCCGMNVLDLPPNHRDYPEHDHLEDGQEEIYVTLKGSAQLQAGGETIDLEPGVLVRVGPSVRRRIVPGEEGALILAIGGVPGKHQIPQWGK
jgi:mannose-6-phosphate isomerase-like protein (cupin superfamily)